MTPIFELSSRLFPSSDARGCENRWNHAVRSGPIVGTAVERTPDGLAIASEGASQGTGLVGGSITAEMAEKKEGKEGERKENKKRSIALPPSLAAGPEGGWSREQAGRRRHNNIVYVVNRPCPFNCGF